MKPVSAECCDSNFNQRLRVHSSSLTNECDSSDSTSLHPASSAQIERFTPTERKSEVGIKDREREREYGLRPPSGIPTHFLCGAKQRWRDGGMEGGLVSYLFI